MKFKSLCYCFLLCSLMLVSCGSSDPAILAQSVTLDKASVSLAENESVTLSATVAPVEVKSAIKWSSSNTKVATVENGVVKALSRGTATIVAKADSITSTCSIVVTRVDLPYKLIWSDEFDGTTLDQTKWSYETGGGGWGNQEKEYYTNRTDNLRFENGSMVIEAKKETYSGNSYTSARINSRDKVSFKYGRIEARMSLPVGKGTWPAFWMMGADISLSRWPLCGEIDIMEHIGSQPLMVSHAVHTSEKNGSKGNNWSFRKNFDNIENNYHTYAIEWEERANEGDDCISFLVDGVKTTTIWEPHVNSTQSVWPFKQNFFIIFNLAIGGNMGGTVDDAIFNSPVLMKVDYVRVYQRK